MYMCRSIYNNNGEVTTQKHDYNISYIDILIYYNTNSGGALLESCNHPTFI